MSLVGLQNLGPTVVAVYHNRMNSSGRPTPRWVCCLHRRRYLTEFAPCHLGHLLILIRHLVIRSADARSVRLAVCFPISGSVNTVETIQANTLHCELPT